MCELQRRIILISTLNSLHINESGIVKFNGNRIFTKNLHISESIVLEHPKIMNEWECQFIPAISIASDFEFCIVRDIYDSLINSNDLNSSSFGM